MSTTILDPTGTRDDDNPESGPAIGGLAGKTVGFRVDIMWRAWDWVSEVWAAELRKAGAEVVYWRSHQGRTGEPGEQLQREMDSFLDAIDVAIVGLGNCGSCTGWTVHDAIAAANRGIPTIAVVTANFELLAESLARRGGRSGLRVYVLPYPLNEQLEDDVKATGREHFPLMLDQLRATTSGSAGAEATGAPASVPAAAMPVIRDCGPEGCAVDWLTSARHAVDADVMAFTGHAMQMGWGDGLPLVPPTEERVREFLASGGRYPDEVIALLPPLRADCTVEKIAINAVMAGAPGESLPLLIAAVEAMADPRFDIGGLNATTGSVVPGIFVNGPIRNELDIPYQHGCFGGAATPAVAMGRALRLLIRNVAGQQVGVTSQSVFGSPGRIAGMVIGEWEERSPWAPLAERRGVPGNAVTVYGVMGTMNIFDNSAQTGPEFLEAIGKSMAEPGANGFSPSVAYGEAMIAINPVWAEIIGRDVPSIEDVQEQIWRHASLPMDFFWPKLREKIEASGRVDANGIVHLVAEPEDVIVMVCGGTGSLHAFGLHSWGTCLSVTRPVLGVEQPATVGVAAPGVAAAESA